MIKEKAVEVFSAVPKMHNCAQAVAYGAGRSDLNDKLAVCGGGKAPGGMCGALYAALLLAPPQMHESIKNEFIAKAGFATCREIKTVSKYPCVECVALASELIEKK